MITFCVLTGRAGGENESFLFHAANMDSPLYCPLLIVVAVAAAAPGTISHTHANSDTAPRHALPVPDATPSTAIAHSNHGVNNVVPDGGSMHGVADPLTITGPTALSCDYRLVEETRYSTFGTHFLGSIGLTSGSSLCTNAYISGLNPNMTLQDFVNQNASQIRALAEADLLPVVNRTPGSLVVLDIEKPVLYDTMGTWNASLLQHVVAAVRMRVNVVKALLPGVNVALYNQHVPAANDTQAWDGYKRASQLGLWDDVSHLVPVLYLGGEVDAGAWAQEQLTLASQISNSTGHHVPLAPFLSWKYFGTKRGVAGCAVTPSDAAALIDAIEAVATQIPPQPTPIPIVHWWAGTDMEYANTTVDHKACPINYTQASWLRAVRVVPAHCKPFSVVPLELA